MTSDQILQVLSILAQQRPLFHSEADFQFALAWHLQQENGMEQVRLERPFLVDRSSSRVELDIFLQMQDQLKKGSLLNIGIELKYKTRRLEVLQNGESYSLATQGAYPQNRYAAVYDIFRLETLKKDGVIDKGFLIFLTNDSLYWHRPQNNQRTTCDQQFKIHEGAKISGNRCWVSNPSKGTIDGKFKPLSVSGNYSIHWNQYSNIPNENFGQFQLTVVEI